METTETRHPLTRLSSEDLDFVLRFVLVSGSLKDLAREYGVSYPTIRLRLDRLIERLKALTAGEEPDPFLDALASCLEQGELTVPAARRLRRVYMSRLAQARESGKRG
ncbi:MAG: DUF2089 family protein [Armatimonadetes bacterium]|nr:DUF2089 family protein [Armatimonadota bacterium]